ncbi:hypothetical protein BJ166DRAFT_9730 [Pestalotiopsis sp. NC0098]|nr:hypothetical protein BJ166DRAFT_9730 [Pestalotiopsis sp. NC0098]
MKFLQVLGWATLAMALPSPAPLDDSVAVVDHLEKRATVTGTVVDSLNDLNTAVAANLAAVQTAIVQIQNANSVAAVITATAAIRSNYQAIVNAITAATAQIVAVTTGATGGAAAGIVGLTQQEANDLANAIQQIVVLVRNIRATLTVTATALGPNVTAATAAETAAIRAAITPFVAPIQALASAIAAASASASLTITGLNAAASGLVTISKQLAAGV